MTSSAKNSRGVTLLEMIMVMVLLFIVIGVTAPRFADFVPELRLRKAADHQDVRAQTVLGRCYEHGRGVAQDYVQAAALYSRAAMAGHKQARLALANLYERGQGVPTDAAKAKALREQAG